MPRTNLAPDPTTQQRDGDSAPGGWDSLTLGDLFYAYRKAKADCFFERSIFIARKFAEFEQDLAGKLDKLLHELNGGDVRRVLSQYLGKPQAAAKKLGIKLKPTPKGEDGERAPRNGHAFFSDPKREFERLAKSNDLTPEFRIVGKFPVEMHILSALWINKVGHLYDAALSESARGSRLRRYGKKDDNKYHLTAVGSFEHYWHPYQKWRDDGLEVIDKRLEQEKSVIAITLDITSYYHNIDPKFLVDERFLAAAGLSEKVTGWKLEFTRDFCSALEEWATKAKGTIYPKNSAVSGVPIGLSMSRVVANVLLLELDRTFEQELGPLYYGRYVDDIFLVLPDPGNILDVEGLFRFISKRCGPDNEGTSKGEAEESKGCFRVTNEKAEISFPYHEHALELKDEKQKLFVLKDQGGRDLLAQIRAQVHEVSSERRLMPSLADMEHTAAARVLTAATDATDEADTLRRADGLSVRRLGWSIQLGKAEMLARDVPPENWTKERETFYQFARDHILRSDRILEQIDYLPRLVSLAVGLQDWKRARELGEAAILAIRGLREHSKKKHSEKISVNGEPCTNNVGSIWDSFYEAVMESLREAALRSWPLDDGQARPAGTDHEEALKLCESVGIDVAGMGEVVRLLRESDLATKPYRDGVKTPADPRPGEAALEACYRYIEQLGEFLNKASLEGSRLPFLFPTRPLTSAQIALLAPEACLDDPSARDWARYVQGVRGVWVKPRASAPRLKDLEPSVEGLVVDLGAPETRDKVRLGITSLKTEDDYWDRAAAGDPYLGRDRYETIQHLVNQAIQARPRPTHLLLPELSLPKRWLETVSNKLSASGIGLIAGLEYQTAEDEPVKIKSEVALVLPDHRLGFETWLHIRQQKARPAPKEEATLRDNHGKEWAGDAAQRSKPIYIDGEFAFGILVCSELQNVGYRQHFQGAVDCVMVLSWNRDLDTFSSLIESTSLDVHAYIALVNNRQFGDSRVRLPAKEHFKRDLCRIRGGDNDQIVVVTVDPRKLREFQSRAGRLSQQGDLFKQVPEDFKIKGFRRRTPLSKPEGC